MYLVRIRPDSFSFTLFLAGLGAILPLSIDMGLPALSTIARALHSDPPTAALTLSVFMAGFAIAPLAFGPISDQYGRRPVLLFGSSVFALAGLGCAVAPSMAFLLAARFIQGAGAGAGLVLVLAIIRDSFTGPEARAKLSYVRVVQTIAPMIAPTLGGGVMAFAGWRAIYGFLACAGFVLLGVILAGFQESAPLHNRKALSAKQLAANYRTVLTNRTSAGFSAVNALSFAGLFSYISGSPLIMLEVLHVSPSAYGLIFASTAFSIMVGAFLNGRLNARGVASARLLQTGLLLSAASAAALVLIFAAGWISLGTIMPFLILTAFSAGLISPNASQGALEPLPDLAGSASAVLGSSQMICAALASAIVAFLFARFGPIAMPAMMTACSLSALTAYTLVLQVPREILAKAAVSSTQ